MVQTRGLADGFTILRLSQWWVHLGVVRARSARASANDGERLAVYRIPSSFPGDQRRDPGRLMTQRKCAGQLREQDVAEHHDLPAAEVCLQAEGSNNP